MSEPNKPQHIVFVSGLSGSGKSTAMAALEDLAFYCIDNLPVQLVPQFLALCTTASTAATSASRAAASATGTTMSASAWLGMALPAVPPASIARPMS